METEDVLKELRACPCLKRQCCGSWDALPESLWNLLEFFLLGCQRKPDGEV